jgi:hypothetical protein
MRNYTPGRRRCGIAAILIAGAALAAAAVSCGGGGPRTADVRLRDEGRSRPARAGDAPVVPARPSAAGSDGQTIYVPAYSSIATADKSQVYQLAITLSVRNTDRDAPIVIEAARYHDQDGGLVRELVAGPLRLAPLAAAQFFVPERDTRGGSAACFLVDVGWAADRDVSDPVAEAVMVGTRGNQGISFTRPGRVVAGRGAGRPRSRGAGGGSPPP